MCHAEENEAINQVSEAVFKRGDLDCNLCFSLAPVKQVVHFGIYEDQKSSMAAIIDNPDFGKLFKRAFVRALALKLSHLMIREQPALKLYRVLKSDPSQREMDLVARLSDEAWLNAIGIDKAAFCFVNEPIPKVLTAQQPQRQAPRPAMVVPSATAFNLAPQKVNQPPKTSFLDMLDKNNNL